MTPLLNFCGAGAHGHQAAQIELGWCAGHLGGRGSLIGLQATFFGVAAQFDFELDAHAPLFFQADGGYGAGHAPAFLHESAETSCGAPKRLA